MERNIFYEFCQTEKKNDFPHFTFEINFKNELDIFLTFRMIEGGCCGGGGGGWDCDGDAKNTLPTGTKYLNPSL